MFMYRRPAQAQFRTDPGTRVESVLVKDLEESVTHAFHGSIEAIQAFVGV
jgi:hypothetical protein